MIERRLMRRAPSGYLSLKVVGSAPSSAPAIGDDGFAEARRLDGNDEIVGRSAVEPICQCQRNLSGHSMSMEFRSDVPRYTWISRGWGTSGKPHRATNRETSRRRFEARWCASSQRRP